MDIGVCLYLWWALSYHIISNVRTYTPAYMWAISNPGLFTMHFLLQCPETWPQGPRRVSRSSWQFPFADEDSRACIFWSKATFNIFHSRFLRFGRDGQGSTRLWIPTSGTFSHGDPNARAFWGRPMRRSRCKEAFESWCGKQNISYFMMPAHIMPAHRDDYRGCELHANGNTKWR